ncbi:hypothetical protein RRG08_015080 [Elysia crispata]|uniref:Uncharacterized protein n=1 Tax=Elysia crispata TaxID=231223 RepID=A0AAE1EA70_9GAST|nr:hypothetical protein RRG08_015080 [Elysia crispata]
MFYVATLSNDFRYAASSAEDVRRSMEQHSATISVTRPARLKINDFRYAASSAEDVRCSMEQHSAASSAEDVRRSIEQHPAASSAEDVRRSIEQHPAASSAEDVRRSIEQHSAASSAEDVRCSIEQHSAASWAEDVRCSMEQHSAASSAEDVRCSMEQHSATISVTRPARLKMLDVLWNKTQQPARLSHGFSIVAIQESWCSFEEDQVRPKLAICGRGSSENKVGDMWTWINRAASQCIPIKIPGYERSVAATETRPKLTLHITDCMVPRRYQRLTNGGARSLTRLYGSAALPTADQWRRALPDKTVLFRGATNG